MGKLLIVLLAAVAACMALGGFHELFPPPPAVPPARASYPAGQEYATAGRYLTRHPYQGRKGMTYGILVRSASPGWASQNLNGGAWSGVVVVPGGRIEHLTSGSGDDGMAAFASPGDEIAFPASGVVDAPSDQGGSTPARMILEGAVTP